MGLESGTGFVGVILNTLIFFPLLVAFTCGVCNACVSSAVLDPSNAGRGTWSKPGPFQKPPKKPAKPSDGPEDQPTDDPDDPHLPPPLFPPPPLDPGPSRTP